MGWINDLGFIQVGFGMRGRVGLKRRLIEYS